MALHSFLAMCTLTNALSRLIFWDKERKARTSQLQAQQQPITAAGFSADGAVLAYASGYDWGQGAGGVAGAQHSILLHKVSSKGTAGCHTRLSSCGKRAYASGHLWGQRTGGMAGPQHSILLQKVSTDILHER